MAITKIKAPVVLKNTIKGPFWVDEESKKGNHYRGMYFTMSCEDGTEYRCFGYTPKNSPHGLGDTGSAQAGQEAPIK